jgi:hypothetical protein
VNIINKTVIIKTVNKMSKHAATAIEGWNRNLMMTALTANNMIADDLGVIAAMIATSHTTKEDYNNHNFVYFTREVMDMVRAGRLVGIPKPEGGMRPIVIGSFFAKLTGSAILQRAGVKSIPGQYAINYPNGAKVIGHIARKEYNDGKAIIRLDIKNAFNTTVRKRILEQLMEEKFDEDVISYFTTMYQPASHLFIQGRKQQYEVIEANEGIRQGDGPSSFFFCLQMRKARDIIVEQHPREQDVKNMAFMDDQTICAPPEHAEAVVLTAIDALKKCGFEVNLEKSAIICKKPITNNNNNNNNIIQQQDAAFPIPIASNEEEFKMLGINITNNYQHYNKTIKERIDIFFEMIDGINIHPQIKHTLLHLCGKPKLLYYCETTPPEFASDIAAHFDKRAKESFARLIGVKDVSLLKDEMIHDKFGGNIPHYAKHHAELYNNSANSALSGDRLQMGIHGLLTSCVIDNFKSPECSHDRQWTHFTQPTRSVGLSPVEYSCALAIRCGIAPDAIIEALGETCRCTCGTHFNVRTEMARHLCSCSQMCQMTFSNRHTFVKDAIRAILARYGISSDNEPNFYTYVGQNHRPDLTVRLLEQKHIAIDITIVKPDEQEIGRAAKKAAAEKSEIHSDAVAKFDHVFIPFALETSGHMDEGCFEFFKKVRRQVPFHQQIQFGREFFGAISAALAKYRARSMLAAAGNCFRSSNLSNFIFN